MSTFQTHIVGNQVAPLQDYSLYDTDIVLRQAVQREGAAAWDAALREHGAWLGRAHTLEAGEQANRYSPRWVGYDRNGHRVDQVEFNVAWHELLSGIVARGLHSHAWQAPATQSAHAQASARLGRQVARAAAYLMQGQVEAGTLCPTTMTFAAVPLLQNEPAGAIDFAQQWLPALFSHEYDPADAPISAKRGALIGMGLTEKQGGSDLRAITTQAVAQGAEGRGQVYRLTGHKWFLSVPHADAHLVLADTDAGPGCFFVPRWIPDGPRNEVRIRRLKDKLGNRSNASGEVEFEQAWGMLMGEPGRGLPLLLQMAATTRLDCVLGSAALLRQAVVQAAHHAQYRQVFGQPLAAQPLMRQVLADLALESEAAMVWAMRLARAVDQRGDETVGANARALVRVGTPAAKLWVCKRAINAIAECMEIWGGNGYIEDGPLARLYRESPVNSIWEGSGNIMALDVLRALQRDVEGLAMLRAELDLARGAWPAYDHALDVWLMQVSDQLPQAATGSARAAVDAVQAIDPAQARHVAAGLARLWQAALLIQTAPAAVADAFVASRLVQPGGIVGELPAGLDVDAILARAWPGIC
ncbi:Acyl-CoA dehydrogenase [Bordetella tumbae]|uniref:acyl-CoA dehydrogenase family protein n=1 Tax=Bordetella tumbae TaxID=1649139 RepID=UPI0039EF9F44